MTKLVVDELVSTLSQGFSLTGSKRWTINAVRPLIYMHNAPAGTFTISFKKSSNVLASKTFTSAEIKTNLATTNNYAYLYKVIDFDEFTVESGDYTLELSSSGYTFSNSSYLGWIKQHENIFFDIDYTTETLGDYPRTLQLFELKQGIYA